MIASAGSTIARAASGSRSSIWLIESLLSANSTVIVFRSPPDRDSGFAGTVIATDPFDAIEAALRAAAGSPITRAPHFLQKLRTGVVHHSVQRTHQLKICSAIGAEN